jgi:NAD(P)-dependent dehydrogenase (short-subunit alcohol dehydrogenase family)
MHALHDKVVLITGASSGIGRAVALRLAQCDCRLALAARTVAALEEVAAQVRASGAEALVIPTDVTQREQCRQAVEAAVERFGRLDVLLCSAGVSMRASFSETEPDALEQVMRVNFFGTMYTTYYAIPHVKKTRGSLVAISSLTGKRGTPSFALYGASKFAVHGLYESLRLELAPDGVHVGLFAPGFVDTPLRERVLGPDGRPRADTLVMPFRIWPVERCVQCIERLILKRQAEVLLPWFVRPLLALDEFVGGRLGDRYLARKFRLNGPGSPPQEKPHQG